MADKPKGGDKKPAPAPKGDFTGIIIVVILILAALSHTSLGKYLKIDLRTATSTPERTEVRTATSTTVIIRP